MPAPAFWTVRTKPITGAALSTTRVAAQHSFVCTNRRSVTLGTNNRAAVSAAWYGTPTGSNDPRS